MSYETKTKAKLFCEANKDRRRAEQLQWLINCFQKKCSADHCIDKILEVEKIIYLTDLKESVEDILGEEE